MKIILRYCTHKFINAFIICKPVKRIICKVIFDRFITFPISIIVYFNFELASNVFSIASKFSDCSFNKFTIVIYIEGDDPDCLNDIIGGEIKMHMEIRGEYKDGKE